MATAAHPRTRSGDACTQFLETTPGTKSNYAFVRQLRAVLGSRETVFMWSHHENTTLNAILDELDADTNPPNDALHLTTFMNSLTTRKIREIEVIGNRSMVDLCRLATLAFYHPATKGSSSIKKILPAVMHSSEYLREKYAPPIYGAPGGILSKNFSGISWWKKSTGRSLTPIRCCRRYSATSRVKCLKPAIPMPTLPLPREVPRRSHTQDCNLKTFPPKANGRQQRNPCFAIANWTLLPWSWFTRHGGSGTLRSCLLGRCSVATDSDLKHFCLSCRPPCEPCIICEECSLSVLFSD